MITIKLRSKIKVEVDAFSFDYTYAGLLVGNPTEEINLGIFESLSFPKNWGKVNCLKIPPESNDFSIPLKRVYYSALLYSSKPINPNSIGSKLAVIWLADEPNNNTIEQIIENGIKNINWEENARDFNY